VDNEIVSIAILLLNAGHEATVHQIGNAVHSLLKSDSTDRLDSMTQTIDGNGQLKNRNIARWLDSQHIDNTVTECLRHDAPLHLFTRYAQQDFMLGESITLPAGEQVALLLGAANHDPRRFSEPAMFWPERVDSAYVSLGAGIHFCVGAALARLEITVALRVLFERLPQLQLAATPNRQDNYHFHGFKSLPVCW